MQALTRRVNLLMGSRATPNSQALKRPIFPANAFSLQKPVLSWNLLPFVKR